MSEIKGPAVIFSERGWKAFLDKMFEMKGEDHEVNKLINDYYAVKRHEPDLRGEPRSDMSYTEAVKEILQTKGPMKLSDIHQALIIDYGINWGRVGGHSNKMKYTMKQFPNIKQLGGGMYAWEVLPHEVRS